MVSDDTAMTEIDKSKAPDLSMKVGYNANFETRETIFRVDGERSLTISLTDNSGTGRSQIHGVWITPNLGARYALGQSVALAAFVGGSSAPLHHVQFLANGIPIASAAAAPFAATWRPVKPGTYVITAQATDTLGATGSSPPVSLHVAGPK